MPADPTPAPAPAPAPAPGPDQALLDLLNRLPGSGFKTVAGAALFLALAAFHVYSGDMPGAVQDLGLALAAVGLRHAIARAAH